jgi:hypothetical protein
VPDASTIRFDEIVRDFVRSTVAAGCSRGVVGFKPLCLSLGVATMNGYSRSHAAVV